MVLFKRNLAFPCILLFVVIRGSSAQEPQEPAARSPQDPTALRDLIAEAERNNPQIAAAEYSYQGATQLAAKLSALPDTQLTLQQFSVGSPRPFAGYTNSEFAYIGIGASQEIPYPGKRSLRAQVGKREADTRRADIESVRRDVIEKIKTVYFQLAYLQQTLAILERNNDLLNEMQQIAESHYRVGHGNQQEVLKAQLQHTKILQEITMHHREAGQLQAQLKQLSNRSQDSPDIETERLTPRSLTYSVSDLLKTVRDQNPTIQFRQAMLNKAQAEVDVAKKEFRPDFNLQYMYENNDRKFRDYYVFTFGINLPNRSRRKAELAEAEANRQQASKQLEAELQQRLADVQQVYVTAQTSAEQLNIYSQGLAPQSEATFHSALAAYQANRQDFQTLMSSFLDVLNLQLDYQRELAEHESALARLETLTGVKFQ